ncbi:hypothetical protein CQ064_32670 [Bacillus sp. MYb78]|uniref:Uncharacterized protein n=1 Tax=Bacillus thuringiensis T01-328 TaxID=1324966 RepID=A0AAN4HAZ0_BACTU|nr:hypothetical protein BTCBT_007412 [Bacillus thuringiensis T01-328]PQZ64370.1 hypothetical protein CQ064_32670 [Bacillus sp. MYb78]
MLFKIFIATCLFSFLFSIFIVTYCEEFLKGERSFLGFISHSIWLFEDGELENSKTLWNKILLLSEILSISFYLHISILYYLCFW